MASAVAAVTAFAASAAPYVSAFTSAYSFIKSRSEGKKASRREADRVNLGEQQNIKQRRIAAANLKRKRIASEQEARIQTSDMLTKGMRAGVVQGGSSGLTNAMGGLFTDATNYQNYLTGVNEAGDSMSATQKGINQATSDVNTSLTAQKGWQHVGDVSRSIGDQFGGFTNPFKNFDTPKTKAPSNYPDFTLTRR